MSKNSKRLVNGVRELVLTDGTTLEDLHMVATDVVLAIEKVTARTIRKLKNGQKIRCYMEDSNKEYGVKGADVICCFKETYDTQTYGTKLRVYDPETGKEWSVGVDCLLEVYDRFDPASVEGKKVAEVSVVKTKRRGRKPKRGPDQIDRFEDVTTTDGWCPTTHTSDDYEKEVDGEEYDFRNPEEYDEFFDD
jgi:hypothetical protein